MTLTIELLLRLILIIGIVLVICTCYLMVQRMREVLGLRKKEAYLREKQMLWYRYFNDAEPFHALLIPKSKYDIQAIEEIFGAYFNHLLTPTITEKIKLFSNQYLHQHYSTLLRSKKWSNRVNSMERITNFYMDSLIDDCEKMDIEKFSHEEHFQLLKIYATLRKEQFINKLLVLPLVLSEYEYKKLLISVDEEILKVLISRIEELPRPCRLAIIDILGIKRNIDYLPFLETQLRHHHDEIRIRTLKAIYEVGAISDLEKCVNFGNSSIWEERLMYAKLLGNASTSYSASYLQVLLQDDSWWVRSQAAQTIGKSKQGAGILKSFIETASDSFAIDMANEVLQGGRK